MKLFISHPLIGEKSNKNYNFTNPNEILMFGMFQTGIEISMCGTNTRKFTTSIIVKDLNIEKEYLYEILKDSIEKSMNCKIDSEGNFYIDMFSKFPFNLYKIMNELISKASKFESGDLVKCEGRILTKI